MSHLPSSELKTVLPLACVSVFPPVKKEGEVDDVCGSLGLSHFMRCDFVTHTSVRVINSLTNVALVVGACP